MNKRVNNKGFTLVELLAVLVILTAIMGIAIPSISSSLERSKNKQNKAREKVLESAAELYITDHKNAVYTNLGSANSCYIVLSNLEEYLSADALKDADDNEISGYILFTKPNTYEFIETKNDSVLSCN
jgi:prepilin-type N-terminal cleavage/methylation domain-containing protein